VEVDSGVLPIATQAVWVQTIRRSHPEAHVWSAPGAEGCGHGGNPRLLGHHSVTLTEKYYAHLAPSSLASAVQRLNKKENLLPDLLTKILSANPNVRLRERAVDCEDGLATIDECDAGPKADRPEAQPPS
jgi:hypothetical protein